MLIITFILIDDQVNNNFVIHVTILNLYIVYYMKPQF